MKTLKAIFEICAVICAVAVLDYGFRVIPNLERDRDFYRARCDSLASRCDSLQGVIDRDFWEQGDVHACAIGDTFVVVKGGKEVFSVGIDRSGEHEVFTLTGDLEFELVVMDSSDSTLSADMFNDSAVIFITTGFDGSVEWTWHYPTSDSTWKKTTFTTQPIRERKR